MLVVNIKDIHQGYPHLRWVSGHARHPLGDLRMQQPEGWQAAVPRLRLVEQDFTRDAWKTNKNSWFDHPKLWLNVVTIWYIFGILWDIWWDIYIYTYEMLHKAGKSHDFSVGITLVDRLPHGVKHHPQVDSAPWEARRLRRPIGSRESMASHWENHP